jgi:hypothetical protein
MKWFKHDTNSGYNAKMKKLLMRYGVKGYGLYYYCIELIAGNLTNDNITFELEHDSQILAHDLKMDSREVEEIMQYCIKLELFEFNTVTQKIVHSGLIEMVDNTMSQHPCIKQIKTSENFKLIKETSRVLQQNRIEQNRTEENIKEDREKVKNKPTSSRVGLKLLPGESDRRKSMIDNFDRCYKNLNDGCKLDFSGKEIGNIGRLMKKDKDEFRKKFDNLHRLCEFKSFYQMTPSCMVNQWNNLTDSKVEQILNKK